VADGGPGVPEVQPFETPKRHLSGHWEQPADYGQYDQQRYAKAEAPGDQFLFDGQQRLMGVFAHFVAKIGF
jgi:hypothetical protein